jgi:hypothetical protein
MTLTQLWAARTLDGKTYHALRPEADPVTALCGLHVPVEMPGAFWVPKYCRKCPRCVAKGA